MANQLLYGFLQHKDLATRRVSEVGERVVFDAINQAVEEHNRQINAVYSAFVERTTEFKVKFNIPTAATLQPLDENGRARPIKPSGQYGVAFPIQMGGAAWGANYISREKMTVQQANDITAMLISADIRWMRNHIMAALFANASWSFNDPEHDALTIKGLANGDTDKYLLMNGADVGATDNHYIAQAGAVADGTNPFPTIYEELTEHPENGGEVVAFIPTNIKSAVQGLSEFHVEQDPNIENITTDALVGSLGMAVPGKVLGYTDSKVWIVEWKALPDNKIVATTTGGAKALKMREYVETSLQGFLKVAERNNHPFYESQWLRNAGFGAWNRVGALVYQVGNGTYSVPTGYSVPLP